MKPPLRASVLLRYNLKSRIEGSCKTQRSKSGKKLYAKRNKAGQFQDIQSYKRAHGQDIKRKSKAEKEK